MEKERERGGGTRSLTGENWARPVEHYSGYGAIGNVSTYSRCGQQVASSSLMGEGEQVGEEAELG